MTSKAKRTATERLNAMTRELKLMNADEAAEAFDALVSLGKALDRVRDYTVQYRAMRQAAIAETQRVFEAREKRVS